MATRSPLNYEQLKEHMIDPALPGVTVVQILEGASRDESLPEWERRSAKAWLDRLVDEQGNPKDDLGRDPMQWAAEENSLSMNGTLTRIERREAQDVIAGRDVLTFIVSHRVRALDRDDVRDQLRDHLTGLADKLTDHLFSETESDESGRDD